MVLLQIASFLFVDGIQPFLAASSPCGNLQNYFLKIFDLGPLMPKIYSWKIGNCTKSPISRVVWQIDRRCLGLPGGFRGWPIKWNHAKCCAMATKFGLGSEIQSPTGLVLSQLCGWLYRLLLRSPVTVSTFYIHSFLLSVNNTTVFMSDATITNFLTILLCSMTKAFWQRCFTITLHWQ